MNNRPQPEENFKHNDIIGFVIMVLLLTEVVCFSDYFL
jgi:hypothetical protein